MLFDYTYLLQDFDPSFFTEGNGSEGDFIFPVDGAINGNKSALFKTLSQSNNRFCLYLPAELARKDNQYLKEEIIQNIVRLLFLPNYLRVQGRLVFFIEQPEEQSDESMLQKLKSEFIIELKKQGIHDITIEELTPDHSTGEESREKSISLVHPLLNTYLAAPDEGTCFEEFTKNFVLPDNFEKKWIVPVSDPTNFERKTKKIGQFENWLRETFLLNIQLVEKYKGANTRWSALDTENKLLKFKLETSNYSLKLMREESLGYVKEVANLRKEVDRLAGQINYPDKPLPKQAESSPDNEEYILQLQRQITAEHTRANAILDWYKKEYEVLPGWYKKFGHIVKVFQGKRTFKSLFK